MNLTFELPELGTDPEKSKTKEPTTLEFDLPAINPSAGVSTGDRQLDSQYDIGTTRELNPEVYRKERQGAGAELVNGLTRTVKSIPFSIAGNVGSILDFEDYYNRDQEVGNWLTQAAEKGKAEIAADNPIYGGQKSLDMGSREWWVDNGSSLAESAASFVATGYGLGRGLTALNGLLKAGAVGEAAAGVVSAVALNQAESIPTAMNIYNKTYQLNLNKGVGEDEARQEAADAAAYSVNINRLNIPLNLTSSFAFLRSAKNLKGLNVQQAQSKLASQLEDLSFRGSIRNTILEGGQEALEETVNNISEKEGNRRGEQGQNYDYNFDTTVSDIFSKEGVQSALLGFLGGAIQTTGTEIANKIGGVNDEFRKRIELQKDALNRFEIIAKSEGQPTLAETLKNGKVQVNLMNQIEAESLKGNEVGADRIKDQLLQFQSLQAFKTGTTDQLIDIFKSVQQDPNIDTTLGDQAKSKALYAIQKIQEWEKVYNKATTKYHPDTVDDIFANRMAVEATGKALDQSQAEIAKLESQMLINDVRGIPNTEIQEELDQAKAEYEQLRENAKGLDEQFNYFRSPEFLLEKQIQKNPPLAVEPEVNTKSDPLKGVDLDVAYQTWSNVRDGSDKEQFDAEVNTGLSELQHYKEKGLNTRANIEDVISRNKALRSLGNKDQLLDFFSEQLTPTEQAEVEEIKPIETPEGPKFKSKTDITNIAHKAYEQDENGNDLIDPATGRKVKNRSNLDLSSPKIKVGDDLIYRLVPGQDPADPNAEIEIALKSQPEKVIGHVHRTDWVEEGTAPQSKDTISQETKAIRDAVAKSENGQIDGKITEKRQGIANFENASGPNGGYTHSLVDTFGDQDPTNPTKFGESALTFTGNKIEEDSNFVNARVPNKLYVNVPTPNGKLFASFVRTNSLKDLGQSEVITTAIQDYLNKKPGDYDTIDKLRNFIYGIYPDKSDTSTPFRLSGKDKLTIEYGNSVFTEGSDFDSKAVQKYLDKAPYRVNTDLLQDTNNYLTHKVVDGAIVPDVNYPNYASYLGNKVIKTNMYPEFTSSNERVFFHQPNVGIGLSSPVTVDKTTGPDVKLKDAINSGDINVALDAISRSNNRYSKLAQTLSGKLDGFKLVSDPKLKSDGKFGTDTITINPNRSLSRMAQALMHESVHALTVSKIESVQAGRLDRVSDAEVQAINNLEDLFNELQANNLKLPESQNNALTSLPEFVAEVMTNKGLQKTLNQIPYGTEKTILDQVIEFIRGIVGLDVQSGSALEKALNDSILLINDGMIVETGEYLLPSKGGFEAIDTGDAANNEYIRRLNNQIRLIRDKLTGDPDKDAELNTQVFGIRKQIGLLINTPDILRVAEDQLRSVAIALDGEVDAGILLSSINTIKGWSDIQSLLQVLPDTAKQTKLKLVIGDAALLEEKWLQKARDYYYKTAKDEGSTLTRKELELYKDIDKFMMYAVDGSISNSAIELQINNTIKVADFRENEEINKKGKELEAQMEAIGGKKAVFADLIQLDKNGNTTPNLVDEFKYEYYEELDAQDFNSKEGLKWLRENTESPTVKNQANAPEGKRLLDQYAKDRASFVSKREALLKKKYLDKKKKKANDQEVYEGNLKKDIEKWERENSPYLREQVERQVALGDAKEKELAGMFGRKYMVQPTPKSKWNDPRYQALKSNDKMFKFYNFFKDTFTEYLPYIEGVRNVRSNAIPEIKKTLSEQVTQDGATSILKGAGKKVVESFTVDVKDDIEYNNLDPATGIPLRRLKTRLLGNNLAPNEKSYDLAKVLTEWIKVGAAIKYKSQVQDKVLLGEKLLQNSKLQAETVDGNNQQDWQGANFTRSGTGSNVQKRVEYTIDAFFGSRKALEGVGKVLESGPLKGKRLAVSKIGDSVIKWGQAASLGLNVISASANVAFGQLTNIQHGAGGQDFTTKQIFSAIGTIAKGVHDQKTRKKVALFMEKLQVMGDSNPTNYGAKSSLDWMYFMSHYGEVFVQGQTMIATMLNTPVIGKDGKVSNAWDVYEVDSNGELKLLPNFDNSSYADVDGSSSMQTIKLSNKIIQLNKMLHGDYDIRSPKLGKKTLLGRSLLVFKNWVPRAYLSRFGSQRYDPALERDVKGRYRSLELKLDTLKNLYALSFVGQLTGAQTVTNLSPTDRANLKVVLREALLLVTMYAASVALRGLVVKGDDDEPSQYLYKVALDTAGRIESDMAFWARPDSIIEMMKNPMAPLRTLENFTSFVSTTSGWVIGNEPINKVTKKGVKLIPILGTELKLIDVAKKTLVED